MRFRQKFLTVFIIGFAGIGLVLSVIKGQSEPSAGARPRRLYTGETFQGRQYPTVAELQHMSLRDLASLRPRDLQGPEKHHYGLLFAKHQQVKDLNASKMTTDAFIDAWVDLWINHNVNSASKQLPNAIKEHLKNDKFVTKDVYDEIIARARQRRNRDSENRRRLKAKDVQSIDDLIRDIPKEAKKQGFKYIKENALRFQKMLYENNIKVGLRAEDIEEGSRHLRQTLGSAQRTTIALRHFLQWRDSDEVEGIHRAMRNRKEFNRSQSKAINNRQQKGKTSSRRGKPLLEVHADSRQLNLSSPSKEDRNAHRINQLQSLLRHSHWWTLE